jgi:hypothetical protein
MKKLLCAVSGLILVATMAPAPAFADAKISCRAPKVGWKSPEKLTQKLNAEGWKIKKVQRERDCYEVYGKTPQGDNVEAFFHPVTLQKILVLKRGVTLFRARGY